MNTPFTLKERREFLDEYYTLLEQEEEMDFDSTSLEEENPATEAKLAELRNKLTDMRDIYLSHLPVIPLSRDPVTGQVVYHSIDVYGLDGPWWSNEVAIRPVEVLPDSFLMLRGSLKLGSTIEKTRYTVYPGPEVPYVVPEVLSKPSIKAVIYQVKVGAHTAYPIFYYFEERPEDFEPLNNWGLNYWSMVTTDGSPLYEEYEDPDEVSWDFDLTTWIEQGKLLWISPDDSTFELKTGTAGCPYLNLQGSQEFSVIYDGELVDLTEEEI